MRKRGEKNAGFSSTDATLRVSVINVDQAQEIGIQEAHAATVRQCHAALLYGDTVDLLSPSAALRYSIVKAGDLTDLELLRLAAEIGRQPTEAVAENLPSVGAEGSRLADFVLGVDESALSREQRRTYNEALNSMAARIEPLRNVLREQALRGWEQSPLHLLQRAIDAGVLSITGIRGAEIPSARSDAKGVTEGLLARIKEILSTADQYPMFDLESLKYVDAGKEAGLLEESNTTRKRAADVAMAAGLIGLLPDFPHATTDEILDIRTHLSKPLRKFRTAVREISSETETEPGSADFADEVNDIWRTKVVPAIEDIDEDLRSNSSFRDLVGRSFNDGASLPGLTAAGSLAGGFALGSGAVANVALASGVGVGLTVATVRSFLAQTKDLKGVADRQYYFLYGANERLRQ